MRGVVRFKLVYIHLTDPRILPQKTQKHTYLLKTVVLEVIHLFLDVVSKIVFFETLSELGIHVEVDGIVGYLGSVFLELLIGC